MNKLKTGVLKPVLFLSIAAVILVSGCTSGGGNGSFGSSRILAIEAFEPDLSGVAINPGEEVRFTLIVRNTGTEKAREITPTIIGLDGWTESSSGCRSGSVIANELSSPNPEFNSPGQSKQCIFSFKAPENLPLDQTFQPKVSIKYIYDSSTVTRIRLPTREKFVMKRDAGEALDSETVFKSTGPIDIDMNTKGEASQIRVLDKDVRFPLFITISNVDGGFVCNMPQQCGNSLKTVSLKLESGAQNKLSLDNCSGDQKIDLFKGQKGELKCDLVARGMASGLVSEEVVSITAKAEAYGYTVEQVGPQLKVKRKD